MSFLSILKYCKHSFAIETEVIDSLIYVRRHSVYSFVHDSSDELKMCPTRKKTDIQVFFIFFPPTCKKKIIFFTKSVAFLSEKWVKKRGLMKFFLLLFYFLHHDLKTLVGFQGLKNIVSVA